MLFFFKQKTAYEMRISDWSSDVCSSDLPLRYHPHRPQARIEGACQLTRERIVVQRQTLRRARIGQRPDDGTAPARERQHRQRPGRQEALPRGVFVRLSGFDVRHHAALAVVVAADLAARELAQCGFGAVRRNRHARIDATTAVQRSEEHTSELQSLMRISYAVFC